MSEHLTFPDSVKSKWHIKRDESFDQFIVLNGKNALGNGGLDHIYMISPEKVGLWISSGLITMTLNRLKRAVLSLQIEQVGNGEAVISCGIEHLDGLCKVARAKRRRPVSEAERLRLRHISPLVAKVTHCNSQQSPQESTNSACGVVGAGSVD